MTAFATCGWFAALAMPSPTTRPTATLIVATYENPSALALVFAGLERQTARNFEILVADDGSGDATARLVHARRRESDLVVRHVWQPDDGLRKSRILNRAILAAAADYLVFLDGDCIPGPDFVASHVALARPRTYLSGSCVLLGASASEHLAPEAVARGALDGLRSCRRGNRRARRLVAAAVPGLGPWLDRRFASSPVGFHGGNASVHREAALAVAGFDERLRRFEDKDFGRRLRLHGLRGESVRYRIPTWHVYHDRPYVDHAMRDESRALYEENIASGHVRTPHGMTADVRDRTAVAGTRME